MSKYKNILYKTAPVLLYFALGVGISGCGIKDSENTESSTAVQPTISEEMEAQIHDIIYGKSKEDDKEKRSTEMTAEGFYLLDDNDERITKPYIYIEPDDVYHGYELSRFIGENGLYGYLSIETGKEIISPQYTKASEFRDGAALVSEGDGIYYITEEGERFTSGYYLDGYEFSETQGSFARVQMEDKTWAIIDRDENILFSGCDKLPELPDVTDVGCAIKEGHAILFQLSRDDENETPGRILHEYPEYCDISEPMWGSYAIVTNAEGLQGAICVWRDEIIVPAEYTYIHCFVYPEENSMTNQYYFMCQKTDGTYEKIYWNP